LKSSQNQNSNFEFGDTKIKLNSSASISHPIINGKIEENCGKKYRSKNKEKIYLKKIY
jgi:hypothetical protein